MRRLPMAVLNSRGIVDGRKAVRRGTVPTDEMISALAWSYIARWSDGKPDVTPAMRAKLMLHYWRGFLHGVSLQQEEQRRVRGRKAVGFCLACAEYVDATYAVPVPEDGPLAYKCGHCARYLSIPTFSPVRRVAQ